MKKESCRRPLFKADGLLLTSQSQRRALLKRDNGVCAQCKMDDRPWNSEHRFPLWLADNANPDHAKYWRIENLETICVDCHKPKTKAEAAQRAKINRLKGPRLTWAQRKKKLLESYKRRNEQDKMLFYKQHNPPKSDL